MKFAESDAPAADVKGVIKSVKNKKSVLENGDGQISTTTARQKLSVAQSKDTGETYLFLMALTPKMDLGPKKLRSLAENRFP